MSTPKLFCLIFSFPVVCLFLNILFGVLAWCDIGVPVLESKLPLFIASNLLYALCDCHSGYKILTLFSTSGSRSAESAIQAAPTTVPIYSNPGQLSLLAWIESLGGGLSEGVEFFNDEEKGHYIRASKDLSSGISSGTIVARCPIAATISYLNLNPTVEGLPQHFFKYNRQFLRGTEPDVASAFLLMDQYLKGDDSPWAPYIKSLPKGGNLTTTQYYEDEDLEWLDGTGLETIRAARLKDWKEKFQEGKMLLKYAGNTAIESYTW